MLQPARNRRLSWNPVGPIPLKYDINSDTMNKINDLLESMRSNPKGIRFSDLCAVCDLYFGQPRQSGSSHRVYKTPWLGDPRVNIQNEIGMAKAYQVRQVVKAIDRLSEENQNVEK
jgi:hypothetical protein